MRPVARTSWALACHLLSATLQGYSFSCSGAYSVSTFVAALPKRQSKLLCQESLSGLRAPGYLDLLESPPVILKSLLAAFEFVHGFRVLVICDLT